MLLPVIFPNAGQFSKLFHWQTHFLLHDTMHAVYAVVMCLSVYPSVCQKSTSAKTAKLRITQTTPASHSNFLTPKNWRNPVGSPSVVAPNACGVG